MAVGQALLERDVELAVLERSVAEAAAGDGRLALVEGLPGIGKTKLLAAARERTAAAGMRCLSARGCDMERAFSFGVVRQLFEPLVARLEEAERAELFGGAAGLAWQLLSETEGPSGGAFAVYHGLYWLTANLAAASPLALFVDDLHWCDPPSLAALEYIGRRLEGLPVLIVLASRPQEPGFDRAILDTLAGESWTAVLAPGALSREATASLLRERLSPDAADEFCDACHAASGGNPLLVAELASALAAEGIEGRADEVPRVDEIGPEAVGRAVRVRLGRLPREAVALARAASVLRDGTRFEDAAALAGLGRDAAPAAAGALVEVDLLSPQERVQFVHPVVRAAVYAGLGPFEQREAHAQAVRVLTAAGRPIEEIAAHVLVCPPAGDENAVRVLREAAARSLADGSTSLAVEYLERALAELPERRAELLFELGTAEQLVNGLRAAGHLREALALTEDPATRGRIALGLGRALYFSGDMLDAKEVFEQALADPVLPTEVGRSLETGLVVIGLFEPPLVELARDRLSHFDLDAPLDDVDALILASYGAYDLARIGGSRELAVARARRAHADRTVFAEESQGAWAAIAGVLWSAGLYDEAQRVAEAVTREGEEAGSAFLVSSGLVMQGQVAYRRGDLADAEAYIASGIELGAGHGFDTVIAWGAASHVLVLLERGDAGAALEVLARFRLDGPLPDTAHLWEARLARGSALVQAGQLDDGIAVLRDVGRAFEAAGAVNPDYAPWRAYLAPALLLTGEVDEARALAARGLELARGWGAKAGLARTLRVYGLAFGDSEPLRESVDLARVSGAGYELGQSLVELGAAERRANRRSAARELLEEGMTLAHRCGARGLEERALQELLATGARPRRALAIGRDALTPSELRVAEMAASGETNRQVAQRLFVTQKTVEAHLARTFRKLGIESRAQLAAALAA
jgi:DNA-binding CsgD family transcriptional regulator